MVPGSSWKVHFLSCRGPRWAFLLTRLYSSHARVMVLDKFMCLIKGVPPICRKCQILAEGTGHSDSAIFYADKNLASFPWNWKSNFYPWPLRSFEMKFRKTGSNLAALNSWRESTPFSGFRFFPRGHNIRLNNIKFEWYHSFGILTWTCKFFYFYYQLLSAWGH